MPAITVRNVRPEVKQELAARAAKSGKSLEAYLREMFETTVARRPLAELIAEIRKAVEAEGAPMDPATMIRVIREERDDPRR
ncbi:MAG: hypothetical protein C0506_02965 [Anaerolinea sp.]|nr:hypothetical protein [Anaerolinea sp.]